MRFLFVDATQEELATAERLATKAVDGLVTFLKGLAESSAPEVKE